MCRTVCVLQIPVMHPGLTWLSGVPSRFPFLELNSPYIVQPSQACFAHSCLHPLGCEVASSPTTLHCTSLHLRFIIKSIHRKYFVGNTQKTFYLFNFVFYILTFLLVRLAVSLAVSGRRPEQTEPKMLMSSI